VLRAERDNLDPGGDRAGDDRAAPPRLRFRPDIEGMRGIAIAFALLYHAGVPFARGGYIGIEIFFVLSGYLITKLLVAELDRSGTLSLRRFYAYRIKRLLPAAAVTLAGIALISAFVLSPVRNDVVSGDVISAAVYVINWRYTAQSVDYFAGGLEASPVQHFWSLAIEEQFYLLWPLVLVAVLVARRSLRLLLAVSLTGVAASTLSLALRYDAADPSRSYYGTDTRAAGLLLGAALATWLLIRGGGPLGIRARRTLSALTAVAVAGIAAAVTSASGESSLLYRGGFAAVAVAVAVVLAHVCLLPGGLPARLLSVAPLRGLGRISYGVYLWHWPVYIAANAERTGLQSWRLFAVRVGLTLALAGLSYILIERPVRTGFRLRRPAVTASGGLGAVAATAALVVAATTVHAVPQDTLTPPARDGLDQVAADPARAPRAAPRALDRQPRPGHAGDLAASSAGPTRDPAPQPPAHHVRPGEPVVVDVFGDSVAWSLVVYLPSHPELDIRDRTSLGCGITNTAPYRYFGQTYPAVMPKCVVWEQRWRQAIAVDNPDIAVVLVGRWETMDRALDGRWTRLGDPAYDAHLRGRLDRAIEIVGARGAQVLLATEPYNRRGERPDGSLFPEDHPSRVTHWNHLLTEAAAAHPGVEILDFGGRVSPEGRYTPTAGGVQVRADGLHLAPDGVQRWIAPWLFTELLKAAPR
jgi:peptidoglycan/LPS O-acetylase OafA/YrhL